MANNVKNPDFIVEYTLGLIDDSIVDYVLDRVDDVMFSVLDVFGMMLIIFIIILGIGVWRGLIKITANDFLYQTIKIAIIYSMISTVVYYDVFFYEFFTNGPSQLARIVTGEDGGSIVNKIDQSYIDIRRKAAIVFKVNADIPKTIAVMLKVSNILFITAVVSLLGGAKVAMAAILILGPIAFVMLLFKSTEKLFHAWLKQLITFFMYFILVFLILGMTNEIYEIVIREIPEESGNIKWEDMVPVAILSTMLTGLLLRVPAIASSIGGGAYLEAGRTAAGKPA
jgi:type IV secretion system protein VirB6